MSYLEKVKEFRKATGLDAGQPVELHDALIREELSELADALADSVVIACGKMADDLADPVWFSLHIDGLHCAAIESGINLDAAFTIVHKSNMSKLCTDEELNPTIAKYEALGVQVQFREVSDNLYACYSRSGHPDYPAGKLLKSVGYHSPDWSDDEWLL